MPQEPFPLANSIEPPRNVRDELIVLSIAVGDRTIDELYRDLGIPKDELGTTLRQLQGIGRVTVHMGNYYPRARHIGAAVVPPVQLEEDAQ